jgi:hypothetical protein
MKKLLEFILHSICDNPDKISIEESETDGIITYSVKLDPQDIGKVIGKQGRIIRSIRTLLRTRAIKEGKRVQFVLQEEIEN